MKKLLSLLFVALMAFNMSGQGIQFEENKDLNAALEKAAAENKLVFIDAYAEWCGPCKVMARDIFPLPEVGEYYNKHFVNLMLDMEKPENREIASKYEVRAFPTYLFLDSEGELVHKTLGSMTADKFIEVAKQAADSENNLMALQRKIDKGDRSYKTIKSFVDANPYDDNVPDLLNDYFGALSEDNIMSEDNWDMFNKFVDNFNSPAFRYVLNNRNAVAAFVGKDKLDNKILNTMSSAYYRQSINRAGEQDLSISELQAIDSELFEKAKANVDLSVAFSMFNRNKEDKASWDKLVTALDPYLASFSNAETLSRFSTMILDNYKQFNDLATLKKAVSWAGAAYKLDSSEQMASNYAKLLFAGGDKKAAKKLAKSVLKTAKKEKNEKVVADFTELLSSFKKK